jgi:hypothetical protein
MSGSICFLLLMMTGTRIEDGLAAVQCNAIYMIAYSKNREKEALPKIVADNLWGDQ